MLVKDLKNVICVHDWLYYVEFQNDADDSIHPESFEVLDKEVTLIIP